MDEAFNVLPNVRFSVSMGTAWGLLLDVFNLLWYELDSCLDSCCFFHQVSRACFAGRDSDQVFMHIKEYAESKGINVDVVNGYLDHAHCLICLSREQTIADVMKIIKGESSYWINRNKLTRERFVWQDDYWAVSVSEKHVSRVRNYILKQEEHHKGKTFETEINRFMQKYGWTQLNKK